MNSLERRMLGWHVSLINLSRGGDFVKALIACCLFVGGLGSVAHAADLRCTTFGFVDKYVEIYRGVDFEMACMDLISNCKFMEGRGYSCGSKARCTDLSTGKKYRCR